MRFDEHFLNDVLSDFSIINKTFPDEAAFSIDSRTLQKGDIFFAIEGSKYDGHNSIQDAFAKGAVGVFLKSDKKDILDSIDSNMLKNKLIVLVSDTLYALVALATAWRKQFDYPVVAVTGSVGKTSTKEIVSNILSAGNVDHVVSYGNENTKIGLALNILKMRSFHKAAVFEIGISKLGEMSQMADMLQPTNALITSIGHAHMEGLGSITDIASEKREIFKHFTQKSIGIINGDQPILADVGYSHPVIKFGSKTTNQIQARKIVVGNGKIQFLLKIYEEKYTVKMKSTHSGSVYNALAAASIAYLFGVSNRAIVKGIQMPVVVSSRFESLAMKEKKGILINDCYNASPESMKAALLALEKIDTNAKKIAVLGDMLELGVNSAFWHRQLGRFLRKVPSLRHVILVGDMVEAAKKTIPVGVLVEHVASCDDVIRSLQKMIEKDSIVLVKGSNAMNLMTVVNHFKETSK